MRKIVLATFVAFAAAGCDSLPTDPATDAEAHRAFGGGGETRTYEITVINLTEGQPLSPGVVATHRGRNPVFRRGKYASEGLRLIAENGDPSVAVAELGDNRHVYSADATTAPVGCEGCMGPFENSLTFEITTNRRARRLSLALMLICTNDGFAGLNRVRLPHGTQARTVYARAYDAGTERNDELWDSIVDPCGAIGPVAGPLDGTNDRPATEQRVRRHRGIRGNGDLTEDHSWRGPVAKVIIRRTS